VQAPREAPQRPLPPWWKKWKRDGGWGEAFPAPPASSILEGEEEVEKEREKKKEEKRGGGFSIRKNLIKNFLFVCKMYKSPEQRLNLSGSWHKGHSHAYNTSFSI
jgi:hypothetical protein